MSGAMIHAAPRARPLTRLSAAQRDRVAARLLSAWRVWCADWNLGRPDVQVEPLVQGAAGATAATAETPGWRVAGTLGDRGGVPVLERGGRSLVRAAMGLSDTVTWPQDSLAAQFADAVSASLRAWRDGWLGPLRDSDAEVSDADTPPARLGALILTFRCAGDCSGDLVEREYVLRVDASALLGLSAPDASTDAAGAAVDAARVERPPLTALPLAIAHLPVRVRVRLDPATLHFGQLSELHPGDVIPLAHPLARPAELELSIDAGGAAHASVSALRGEARLGRQGARFAVRIDPS